MWAHFLGSADVLIYVVDASDSNSFQEAVDCLDKFVPVLKLKPGLVFMLLVNKVDLLEHEDISEKVETLRSLFAKSQFCHQLLTNQGKQLQVQTCSALHGEGVFEAILTLLTQVPSLEFKSNHFGDLQSAQLILQTQQESNPYGFDQQVYW